MKSCIVAIVLLLILCVSNRRAAAAVADITISADNQAYVSRIRDLLAEVEQKSPFLVRNVTSAHLLALHDAAALQHAGSTVDKVGGSFAEQCVIGKGTDATISGPGEFIPAGHYLVLFRYQSQDDAVQGFTFKAEVRANNGARRLGSSVVLNSNAEKGAWRVVAVRAFLRANIPDVEYRFWSLGHSVAIDQVLVLQTQATPMAPGMPAATSGTPPGASPAATPGGIPANTSIPTETDDAAAKGAAIDISVPSAPLSAAPKVATPTNTSDSDEIERPEYQNAPKALEKSVTSVTSMMVTIGDDGEAHGLTSDIIAVVPPESRRSDKAGIGFARTDGDDEMKTALQEAVRAVTLRYPIWTPGHIDLSFGEKFISHGGPSAGTAFGVLMLSVLEGFSVDPKCAVTGDITVDWKVRKVGGVSAKLHGATLDKCLLATIPEDNEAAFADMGCLYGHSALWAIQVFSIGTLQDAVAIARTDRPHALSEAISLFADLQPQLDKDEAAALRNPKVIDTLHSILALAPNDLSAKYVLALSDGTLSPKLSENGTLHQLSVIFHPFRAILINHQKLDRTTLPPYMTALAKKRLNALKPIASKELLPLVNDIDELISSMNEFAEGEASADEVQSRAQAVNAGFAALDSSPDFADRLVREGY